jgi:hypothetical protein
MCSTATLKLVAFNNSRWALSCFWSRRAQSDIGGFLESVSIQVEARQAKVLTKDEARRIAMNIA